ncbi:MAG: phosphonate ABC transporter ATP-binding protein [Coriobacteriia bacterium]|nr:phosphonate ABC transporter ATP-binding protein [Coriobacteriia bacterium]
MSTSELLEIEGLSKSYRDDQFALKDVSTSIRSGELISIIGSSGAGKSTLLRCINRLIEASSGSIKFKGQEVTTLKNKELKAYRRDVGMIFQSYNLIYRLSAIENVLHGRLGYKNALAGALGLYSEEEKQLAFQLLDEVGLAEFAYRRADRLSGGQKQRVGIARALCQQPSLMLCDEPIASLDPKSSKDVMDSLRKIVDERQITCIVNLHQVKTAIEYSDRIIGLRHGEKVFEGDPSSLTLDIIEEIYEGTKDEYTEVAAMAQISTMDVALQDNQELVGAIDGN